jgi:hypothetical protein
MSKIKAAPKPAIRLQLDAVTLRKQLRYAFAHAFSVVQELIQNARRAGATEVIVDYDEQTKILGVADDGCGIADFQTMLTFAASGWDEATTAAEQPYGMGFMASLFSSTKVEVRSRGQCLTFDTAGMLSDKAFELTPAPERTRGTQILLHGVTLRGARETMLRIARGYAIPIIFNGETLARPDAPDEGEFHATEVGRIRLGSTYSSRHTVAYIQGFRVHEPERYWSRDNVVHLDPTKYRGVFPDRDRCIDEAEMLTAVDEAVKRLYTERLLAMKAQLAPAEFCRKAYELARSLNRLDVFDDVDAVPGEWLARPTTTPRSGLEGDRFDLTEGTGEFSRAQIESGEVPLVNLQASEGFEALDSCGEDGQAQLLWLFAYASGAYVLSCHLRDDHWLYRAAEGRANEVVVEATVVREGRIPWERTVYAGRNLIQLCTGVSLRCGDRTVEIDEPIAVLREGEPMFVVPCIGERGGALWPQRIEWNTLRQASSYVDDSDDLDEAALETDEREANQAIRALLAPTPSAHLQLLLDAALRDYRSELKRFASVTIAVDNEGSVTVKSIQEAQATPA